MCVGVRGAGERVSKTGNAQGFLFLWHASKCRNGQAVPDAIQVVAPRLLDCMWGIVDCSDFEESACTGLSARSKPLMFEANVTSEE